MENEEIFLDEDDQEVLQYAISNLIDAVAAFHVQDLTLEVFNELSASAGFVKFVMDGIAYKEDLEFIVKDDEE